MENEFDDFYDDDEVDGTPYISRLDSLLKILEAKDPLMYEILTLLREDIKHDIMAATWKD